MYSAYFYIMCMKSSNHKEEHRSPQHLPCTTTKLYIAFNRISFWCILYTTDVQTVHQTEYSYSFVVSIILYSYFTLFILLFSFLSLLYTVFYFLLNEKWLGSKASQDSTTRTVYGTSTFSKNLRHQETASFLFYMPLLLFSLSTCST